jgi:hypothetical protein
MVTVPAFLLRRLYLKQSLRNTSDGVEFLLKNNLGSGYAHKMQPLKIDSEPVDLGKTLFFLDGKEPVPFSAVAKEKTFTLAMNKSITIRVEGMTLQTGPHKIEMGFDVPGLGTLRFDFTDSIGDE